MKNLFKGYYLVLLSILVLASSCSNEGDITKESLDDFGSSVAIINTNDISKQDLSNIPITVALINFNSNYMLEDKYKINDIEYSDNGLFNDEVAGDGIYTSVEKFDLSKSNNSLNIKNSDAFVGSNFAYLEELKSWLNTDNNVDTYAKGPRPTASITVSVGCDIVTRPCPQTTWYNTCWFSNECTCVYLENCEAEVSIEVGI